MCTWRNSACAKCHVQYAKCPCSTAICSLAYAKLQFQCCTWHFAYAKCYFVNADSALYPGGAGLLVVFAEETTTPVPRR